VVEEDGTSGHSGRREVETSEEGNRSGRRSFKVISLFLIFRLPEIGSV
jgi:hypothetical protein